jgi:small subunit ribosomal protein S21
MKDTNTHENLLLIYQAMSAIDKNDRSLYFLNYYKEVQERIRELYELSKYEKNTKKNTHCQNFFNILKYLYYMIVVNVNNDGIEKALKTFKYKVNKIKQNKILLGKKEFVKKSIARRTQILKASYTQKVKSSLN